MIIEAEGKIKITKTRWNVRIEIEGQETYVASADSFYTESNGIWFGTQKDYDHWDDDEDDNSSDTPT